MDWDVVGRTGVAPDAEFEANSFEQRLGELDRGLEIAADTATQSGDALRIVHAVLHLLDAFDIGDERLRAAAGLASGVLRAQAEQPREAILQLRRVLDGPDSPASAFYRAQARMSLASLILSESPDEAQALLEHCLDWSRRSGDRFFAANSAVSLGALLRRGGVYERALEVFLSGVQDLEGHDAPMIEASLHGNLGNLLSDNLGRLDDAMRHYRLAVAAFERGGHLDHAAARRFHLADVAIKCGSVSVALDALGGVDPSAVPTLDAMWDLLDSLSWETCPDASWPQWEALFARFLEWTALEPRTRASLLATLMILRARYGDHNAVVALAEEQAFQALDDVAPGAVDRVGGLRDRATAVLLEASMALGRQGLAWLVPWRLDAITDESRAGLCAAYRGERATVWLAAQVDRIAAGERSIEAVSRAAQSDPEARGIARVPATPPAWLGTRDAAYNSLFAGVRAAVAPSREDNDNELIAAHGAMTAALSSGDAVEGLAHARRGVEVADRDGDPRLMCDMRMWVARLLERQPGGFTRGRFEDARAILHEAQDLVQGIPSEEVRALLNLGLLLTEAPFGDRASRMDEAIAVLERARDVATRRKLFRKVAPILINLANALSEHPDADSAGLAAATRHLEDARAHIEHAPQESREEIAGVLENSLGNVLLERFEAGERGASELLASAVNSFKHAVAIRERGGDPTRLFLSLSNLIAARLRQARPPAEPLPSDEIDGLVVRLIEVGARVPPRIAFRGLTNAATAVARTGASRRALELARRAVECLDGEPDATQPRVLACTHAARLHLEFGDISTARALCEQGMTALEAFRADGGDAFYRGSLVRDFGGLYRYAMQANRAAGAPAEDIWWTMERFTGRTLVEDGRRAGISLATSRADVLDSLRLLPADTVVVQLHDATAAELSWIRIRSVDQRLEMVHGQSSGPPSAFLEASGGALHDGAVSVGALSPDHAPWFNRQLLWVSEHVLARVLSDLSDLRIRRIVFISQGLLSNVPWALVPVPGDPTSPLGSKVLVHEVPSATMLASFLERPRRAIQKAVLIACDPTGTLSHHIGEVRSAFASLRAQERIVITDVTQAVTPNRVLEAIRDADLVHFACHGHFDVSDPAASGLLLTGDVLTLRALVASKRDRPLQLAFLSACETSIRAPSAGDAPNLLGAFIQAGASVAIGAQWRVPDVVAMATARLFYELTREGLSACAALCEAHRRLRQAPRAWPDAYCASFKSFGWD